MTQRIFICAERRFPRGDAGANLVLYLAKALQDAGLDVYIISIGQTDERLFNNNMQIYEFNGLKFKNVLIRDNIFKKLDENLFSGKRTIKILKEFKINSNDKVIIYSSNAIYTFLVQNYVYKHKKCTTFMEVVEYFQKNQFKGEYFNPKYWLYLLCFHYLYSKTKNVIAISEYLKGIFEKKKCNVFRVPLILDVNDFSDIVKKKEERINLIYSGNPGKKEAFSSMLKALVLLDEKERKKIVFNITGVSKKTLEKLLGKEKTLLNELKNIIVFHRWMSYQDLLCLYAKIDFLYFIRNNNIITIANYPSKVPELMACGVIPASNTIGDFSKILKDNRDSILEEGFSEHTGVKILKRILMLKTKDIEEMSENAKATVKQNLQYNLWSKPLFEFIKKGYRE